MDQGKLLDVAAAPMYFAIFGIPFLMILVVAAIILLAVFLIRRAVRRGGDTVKPQPTEDRRTDEDSVQK